MYSFLTSERLYDLLQIITNLYRSSLVIFVGSATMRTKKGFNVRIGKKSVTSEGSMMQTSSAMLGLSGKAFSIILICVGLRLMKCQRETTVCLRAKIFKF